MMKVTYFGQIRLQQRQILRNSRFWGQCKPALVIAQIKALEKLYSSANDSSLQSSINGLWMEWERKAILLQFLPTCWIRMSAHMIWSWKRNLWKWGYLLSARRREIPLIAVNQNGFIIDGMNCLRIRFLKVGKNGYYDGIFTLRRQYRKALQKVNVNIFANDQDLFSITVIVSECMYFDVLLSKYVFPVVAMPKF